MKKEIPSLLSLLEKQFAGTSMSQSEMELARLCWLGGAWALFKGLEESLASGNLRAAQRAYAEELTAFVLEVRNSGS